MTTKQSAPTVWAGLVAAARKSAEAAEALQEQLNEAKQEIVDALEELKAMAEEYGEKFDNMNEGLQASPYGQKCEAMQQLDLDASSDEELEELIAKVDEAEGAEIPLGFGRD